MPSTPSAVEIGSGPGSIFLSSLPAATAYSCHPNIPSTRSPTWSREPSDSSTRATPAPGMTSPMATGRAADSPPFIRPRMEASSAR